jgi:wyosine [tRNA(Phe)-imidazoG37] synthetase (radical SAM superfamily)
MNETPLPYLLVSDQDGNMFEIEEYQMLGMSLSEPVLPETKALISLPHGSNLYVLPGRTPVGYDPKSGRAVEVPSYKGNALFAVAAFMAPAYLQLLRSAYVSGDDAPSLPLYSYTAVGWRADGFVVPAMRIDPDERQDLRHVDLQKIERGAERMLRERNGNRLAEHLVENCVRRYGCPAARNWAVARWEAPLPTSNACNAACVGCISMQEPETGVCAPQNRIAFLPTPEEIADVAVPHLEQAKRPVVSFGQGCEGEPLMVGDTLEAAIRIIRSRTDRGIVNLNTNGSRPTVVERLFEAGLDSIRVSMNSAQEPLYRAYFRPRNYAFDAVRESLCITRRYERWSSVNYFIYPGLTDSADEMAALHALIADAKINMIQTRNLNIDPEWYEDELDLHSPGDSDATRADAGASTAPLGIAAWVDYVRARYPWIKLGYFNPPREEMKDQHYVFDA